MPWFVNLHSFVTILTGAHNCVEGGVYWKTKELGFHVFAQAMDWESSAVKKEEVKIDSFKIHVSER